MKTWTLSLLLVTATAQAQTSDDFATSVGKPTALTERITRHLATDFWGNLSAGGLDNMQNGDTPNPDGSVASPQGLNSAYLALRYKLGGNRQLGLLQNFNSNPHKGTLLDLGDLALSFKQDTLVDAGTFHMHVELQAVAPTSVGSVAAGARGGLREITVMLQDLPGTRLMLGSYSVLQTTSYGDAVKAQANGGDDFYVYQAPFVNLQTSAKTAASLWVDLISAHQKNGQTKWALDQSTFKPGFSWDFAHGMNLNPYLNISSRDPRVATSFFGAFLTIRN